MRRQCPVNVEPLGQRIPTVELSSFTGAVRSSESSKLPPNNRGDSQSLLRVLSFSRSDERPFIYCREITKDVFFGAILMLIRRALECSK